MFWVNIIGSTDSEVRVSDLTWESVQQLAALLGHANIHVQYGVMGSDNVEGGCLGAARRLSIVDPDADQDSQQTQCVASVLH
ncbi:hypothetical protein P3W23_09190 [Luteibacter sp. PPL554]